MFKGRKFMIVTDVLLTEAQKTSVSSVHEAAGRKGALPQVLRPLDPAMRTCGRAFTVRCPSGDNLWIHHALVGASAGDVLVVDAGPSGASFGYWGEIMATAAITARLSGLVITGGVRDMLQLIEIGLPTFSVSVTMQGTVKQADGDGAIGEPVRVGDVIVRPGDLVMGDADGVIVLSPEQAAAAIPRALDRDEKEIEILRRIRAGESTLDVYNL